MPAAMAKPAMTLANPLNTLAGMNTATPPTINQIAKSNIPMLVIFMGEVSTKLNVVSEQMTLVLDNAWKQRSLFLANQDSSFVSFD